MDTELNTSGMEEVDYLAALLLKQLRNEITEAELQFLENWKASHPSHALVSELVNDSVQLQNDLLAMKQVDMEGRWQQISAQVNLLKKPVPLFRRWYTYAAAALVLLIAGAITWPYWKTAKAPEPVVINEKYLPANISISPGGNKAVLTLSNGLEINLENAANGKVAQEGNVMVMKQKEGEVKYEQTNSPSGDVMAGEILNTLSTPRGGQYSLVLPDGSKVWLNAASSIKYPTHFATHERRVAITGEVYFEVKNLSAKRGKRKPFIVDVLSATGSPGAVVEVLGTQFNVMAYNDESAITATLVNGKVKVSVPSAQDNNFKLLVPGQQAQIAQASNAVATSELIKVVKVDDMDDALAWKRGFISLNNSDIKYIMRSLSRWYNIDVNYPGKVPDFKFTGSIPRSENISTVIKTMEYAGVHFKLEKNNTISVLP
ncbi:MULTISPECIES: FecR family protein [Niastella]|uniref:FecR family protein n=1 Tax=Niastella soli TaxID=2821487 RepID=A0ABS3Z0C9_9BACT|nr:FecR family protein [Niastella soli]MBO9203125.1 FecR family protein [Niastella soli]